MVNEVLDDKAQLQLLSRELAVLKQKQAEGESGNAPVGNHQAEEAERTDKIERLKNLVPVYKKREPLLTVSPRCRRTKRSHETCPTEGGVSSPLSLLISNNPGTPGISIRDSRRLRLSDLEGQEALELKEKMTTVNESLQDEKAELFTWVAGKLENQLEELEVAIKDRGQVIAEIDASGQEVTTEEEGLAELKATLEACQKELTQHKTRADDAEAELKELVEDLSSTKARLHEERDSAKKAASRREREVTSESQKRILDLEAEKASLEEQEAELRARNADAAMKLSEQEALLTSVAKDDTAQKSVADAEAEVEKRDCLLAGLQGRVGELERNLADAMKDKQELIVRMKEEKFSSDSLVINSLKAKKRAERALIQAYELEDTLRVRAQEANLQVEEAEAALERKDAKIAELHAHVKRLEVDTDMFAQLEEDWELLHGEHEMILYEKQKLEEELAVARADAEELGMKMQKLSDSNRRVEVLSAELSAAKASASEAQVLANAELLRLAEEETNSKDQMKAVQSQLEAKSREVLSLRADSEDLRVRLAAVEKAAAERKVAEVEMASVRQQAAFEISEAQSKADGLASELESVRELLEASKRETANVNSKHEAEISEIRGLLERSEVLATANEIEMASVRQQAAFEISEAQSKADGLASELESVRELLEASKRETANVNSKHEAEKEKIRADLARAEALAIAKDGEVVSLRRKALGAKTKEDALKTAQRAIEEAHASIAAKEKIILELNNQLELTKTDLVESIDDFSYIASELKIARGDLEASKKEAASITDKHEGAMGNMRAALERAEGLVAAKQDEVCEVQAKGDDLASELETVREALEASNEEATIVGLKHEGAMGNMRAALERAEGLVVAKEEEVTNIRQQYLVKLQEAHSQLEIICGALEAACVASKPEAAKGGVSPIKRAEAFVTAKEEEVARLKQQAADEIAEAQAERGSLELELETLREALEAKEMEIRDAVQRAEASAASKGEEVASLREQAAERLQEALAKQECLMLELETTREALETNDKEMCNLAREHETEMGKIRSDLERAEALVRVKEEEACEEKAKAEDLVSELEIVRQTMAVDKEEVANVVLKHEGAMEDMRSALERAEALVAIKEEEVSVLHAKEDGVAAKLEAVREALEAKEMEIADVSSKYEATMEDIRAALECAERSVEAKEAEVRDVQVKADRLVSDLETVREAFEVSEKEVASQTSKHEVVIREMQAALDRAEGLVVAKEEEVTNLRQQSLDELQEAQTKVDDLSLELEILRGDLEASKKEAACIPEKHDVETSKIRAALERAEALAIAKEGEVVSLQQQLCEAQAVSDGFSSELESVREALDVYEKEMVEVASKHEAEMEDIRVALEQAKVSATAKEEEVAGLLQKKADDLNKAQATVDAANASVSMKDDVIAKLNERLVEKGVKMSELRQELDSVSSELTALKERPTPFHTENSNGSEAEAKAELRRLKVELDIKGSEMDRLLKVNAQVHGQLEKMRCVLSSAGEAGADASGVDPVSLRKRISQLECENGLLRGEKDRIKVLATAAAVEAKTSAARAAAKMGRLKREVLEMKKREEIVSAAKEDGDRAMEAKLSELRKERLVLQGKTKEGKELRQRLRDQVAEMENLRNELVTSRERCEEAEAAVRAGNNGVGSKAFAVKKKALDELQTSMDQPPDTTLAGISALKRKIKKFEYLMEQKNARIAHLESVRLSQYQVEKLSAMKEKALSTSAENKELKQRLAELERRIALGGGGDGEKGGVVAPEECESGDAILEVVERAAGAPTGVATDQASEVAAADRQQGELKKAKAALQKEEFEPLSVQEQMRAGVLKHRALEADVSAMRQQLTTAEMGKREAVSKRKERDHEHELKFLQTEERVCSDKSNVLIETSMASRESTSIKREHPTDHTAAAQRRVRARALLEENPSTAEEDVGECKQS